MSLNLVRAAEISLHIGHCGLYVFEATEQRFPIRRWGRGEIPRWPRRLGRLGYRSSAQRQPCRQATYTQGQHADPNGGWDAPVRPERVNRRPEMTKLFLDHREWVGFRIEVRYR